MRSAQENAETNGTKRPQGHQRGSETLVIRYGKYTLKPYSTQGKRCWELYITGRSKPECYPSTLGRALRWIAEYELRNGGDEDVTLSQALERYESVCAGLEDAAARASGGD